jgi:hypothetical protein
MSQPRSAETRPIPRAPRRFWNALAELARIAGESEPPGALWHELVIAWGDGWSAGRELLAGVAYHARRGEGPILECGSGLTTAVLAVLSDMTGRALWTLEHLPRWGEQTRRVIERVGGRAVSLHVAPLRDHGGFDWYDPPREVMPRDFGLVVCDGPPGRTRGGRYGLVPVLGDHLRTGCPVLLDDARRPGEARILEAWSRRLEVPYELYGIERPFGVLHWPGERCQEPFVDNASSSC